ncbi:hypothetical protein SDC9_146159 [bioreactor metagenome]|uniref:Uncharacterized protein n=1 Tax=bioreactor metagenome TaxID=1076179 RepID=A0A645ECB5_9ZZZZ|nr:hypothetical protein [Christensenella sp.]
MRKADTRSNKTVNLDLQRDCAGIVAARAASAHAAFAEYLLAMRMRQHAEQANAAATIP